MKKMLIAILLLVAACVPFNKPMFSINVPMMLESENVTIRWIITDDRSENIEYILKNDGIIIANGTMLNNTMIELEAVLDPNKESRNITLYAIDESGNMASTFAIVNLTDTKGPSIVLFEISGR